MNSLEGTQCFRRPSGVRDDRLHRKYPVITKGSLKRDRNWGSSNPHGIRESIDMSGDTNRKKRVGDPYGVEKTGTRIG